MTRARTIHACLQSVLNETVAGLIFTCDCCGREFADEAQQVAHRPACRLERAEYRIRADREWNEAPPVRTALQDARAHLASITPERRAALEGEWE